MLARAPGKVVLSGAYAVLEGAPAVVSAVDRYVLADAHSISEFTTPEFAAAHPGEPQPSFDARALRDGSSKLGLGSSAAILVACLGALHLKTDPSADLASVRAAVYPRALAAHRAAQGGGSGVDVAASAHGGHLLARVAGNGELALSPVELPAELWLEVWATGLPASTRTLIAAVFELRRQHPVEYSEAMGLQAEASESAATACTLGSAPGLVQALARQHEALLRLGQSAKIAIVVDEVQQLHRAAQRQDACVLPAGAGGGDISIYAGARPPSDELRELAGRLGQKPLDLRFGAPGLEPHRAEQLKLKTPRS